MSHSLTYNHYCPRLSSSKTYFQHPLRFSAHHLSKSLLILPQNPKPLCAATATTSSGARSNTETLPKSAIQRIAEKLRSLGFVENSTTSTDKSETDAASAHADSKSGEIFIPNSTQLPKSRVGYTLDPSWSTPENPVPEVGTSEAILKFHRLRGEVAQEKEELRKDARKEKVPTLAELNLPKRELRRLRTTGIKLDKKMKIGKAGITEGIVNGIHERWRSSEVVKIIVEDIFKLNMRRTHDILERKTGGMVVWRAGSKIVLYRGVNYRYPYFKLNEASSTNSSQNGLENDIVRKGEQGLLFGAAVAESGEPIAARKLSQSSLVHGVGSPGRVRFQLPGEKQLVEEADHLLDGLGPRFTDWWGYDPLPVDADQLPAIVPGYRRPFRLLPYGVKPKLTDDEMTVIKRLGRPLPCHFALGRNRNLQGLAAAIVKLWEKCEIAKIAVKRGVQNTNSEMMAEELKRLTGGTLISRDKEFLVFYRGKDFLPSAASSALEERRKDRMQKDAHWTNYSSPADDYKNLMPAKAGNTLPNNDHNVNTDSEVWKMKAIAGAIEKTSTKLSVAIEKKARAEKHLADLEQSCISQQIETDKEGITKEEKYMLRKVGLRMKPFLLMGRRGVFDGTIENMHLHWKYRELVKIICTERSIEEVHKAAQTLESESGGILVAVERARKGYAIIVYRGKNYRRPATMRPQTLLNKKEAMRRALEAQKHESLKLHVLKLTRNVEKLKHKLVKDQATCSEWSKILLNSPSAPLESMSTPVKSEDVMNSQDDSLNRIQKELQISSLCEYKTESAKQNGAENSSVPCDDSERNVVAALCSGSDDFISMPVESSLGLSTNDQARLTTQKPSEDNHDHAFSRMKDSATSSQDPSPTFQKVENIQFHNDRQLATSLSNKDRLLLRKQALKMRKRPVLAVGRSNAVTGIAKTIKEHFKKHPLAIVNVKGRAKGTSVQEVIYKLEQATGAILVSQEPSKVILYRGWGAGLGTANAGSQNVDGGSGGGTPPSTVSPELIEAMRLECGLP